MKRKLTLICLILAASVKASSQVLSFNDAHQIFSKSKDLSSDRELIALKDAPLTCLKITPNVTKAVPGSLRFTDRYSEWGNQGLISEFTFFKGRSAAWAKKQIGKTVFMHGIGESFSDALRGDLAIRKVTSDHYLIEQTGGTSPGSDFVSWINSQVTVSYYYSCRSK